MISPTECSKGHSCVWEKKKSWKIVLRTQNRDLNRIVGWVYPFILTAHIFFKLVNHISNLSTHCLLFLPTDTHCQGDRALHPHHHRSGRLPRRDLLRPVSHPGLLLAGGRHLPHWYHCRQRARGTSGHGHRELSQWCVCVCVFLSIRWRLGFFYCLFCGF